MIRDNPSTAGHPSLEAVAAFVDGRLGGEERRRMVEHLAHCDDCQELVTETVLLLRETDSEDAQGDETPTEEGEDASEVPAKSGHLLVPSPRRFRRALPLIAALAAAACLALLIWTPAGEWILGHAARDVSVADLTTDLPASEPALRQAVVHPLRRAWLAYPTR